MLENIFKLFQKDKKIDDYLPKLHFKAINQISLSLLNVIYPLYSRVNDVYHTTIIDIVNFISNLWPTLLLQSHFDYLQFQIPNFNQQINLQIEFDKYIDQSHSWCYVQNGSFILSTEQKIDFIKLYYQDIFQRNTNEKFHLSVDRNSILKDSLFKIANIKNPEKEFKKRFFVEFVGEPINADSKNILKEYFELIVLELFHNTHSFFQYKGNFSWFNPKAIDKLSIDIFYLAGVLLGITLLNVIQLNVKFPIALYRMILNLPNDLDELEEINEFMVKSLKNILNHEGNVQKDLKQVFVYYNVSLKPDGVNIPVTNENRNEYSQLVVDYIFNKSVQNQYSSFVRGIDLTISLTLLKIFHPKELDLLVTISCKI
jgi:hypothetical protein